MQHRYLCKEGRQKLCLCPEGGLGALLAGLKPAETILNHHPMPSTAHSIRRSALGGYTNIWRYLLPQGRARKPGTAPVCRDLPAGSVQTGNASLLLGTCSALLVLRTFFVPLNRTISKTNAKNVLEHVLLTQKPSSRVWVGAFYRCGETLSPNTSVRDSSFHPGNTVAFSIPAGELSSSSPVFHPRLVRKVP